MANKEHLALFKQGVEAWSQWRRGTPGVRLDLSRANLVGAHLRLLALLSLGTVALIIAVPLWQ
jgi:hypothetical protein